MADQQSPHHLDDLTARLQASQISATQDGFKPSGPPHQNPQNASSGQFGGNYSRQAGWPSNQQMNQTQAGYGRSQSTWTGDRAPGQGWKGQGGGGFNNGQSFHQQRQSTYPPPARTASLLDYVKGSPSAAHSSAAEPLHTGRPGPPGLSHGQGNPRMHTKETKTFARQNTFPSHNQNFASQTKSPQGQMHASPIQGDSSQSTPNRNRQWQNPRTRNENSAPPDFEFYVLQCQYLDELAAAEVPKIAVTAEELESKEKFRQELQRICQDLVNSAFPGVPGDIDLVPYGSIQSGFATKNSDMDLLFLWKGGPPMTDSANVEKITELIEAGLLNARLGARLISKTRVPVIKVCEHPSEQLLAALLEELQKTEEEKDEANQTQDIDQSEDTLQTEEPIAAAPGTHEIEDVVSPKEPVDDLPSTSHPSHVPEEEGKSTAVASKQRPWFRERPPGPLDFPKTGVGIQCDIGFTKFLSIYNTHLLRCYSACDPRVKEMVLFVKSWARIRRINSSYSGTLSSYGWALMVLHFLINIAKPPVLPNLQQLSLSGGPVPPESRRRFGDYDIEFFDNTEKLTAAGRLGQLTRNMDPIGSLLRGFFQYYAQQGGHIIGGGFQWKNDIISLRTIGGVISKQSKGWVAATTTYDPNGVEVRQRYLLAIECPMETEHNVARTVHHNGIVAIRDEFRRAYRILTTAAWTRKGYRKPEGLLDPLTEQYEQDEKESGLLVEQQ
jgi:terminal uridylyltransferase